MPLMGFAIIGCLPITHVAEINDIVKEAVKKYDVRDPLTGEPQEHELIVIPYDRSSTVYVEQEIPMIRLRTEQPLSPDAVLMRMLRENRRPVRGASHTIPIKR